MIENARQLLILIFFLPAISLGQTKMESIADVVKPIIVYYESSPWQTSNNAPKFILYSDSTVFYYKIFSDLKAKPRYFYKSKLSSAEYTALNFELSQIQKDYMILKRRYDAGIDDGIWSIIDWYFNDTIKTVSYQNPEKAHPILQQLDKLINNYENSHSQIFEPDSIEITFQKVGKQERKKSNWSKELPPFESLNLIQDKNRETAYRTTISSIYIKEIIKIRGYLEVNGFKYELFYNYKMPYIKRSTIQFAG